LPLFRGFALISRLRRDFALALTENQATRRRRVRNAIGAGDPVNRISVLPEVNSDRGQTPSFMAALYLVMAVCIVAAPKAPCPVLLSAANSGECEAVAHCDCLAILMPANRFLPWPGSHKPRKNLEETS
jgi:hypothetical protein